MTIEKKHLTKIQLKDLHTAISNGEREMTDDELDMLIIMFQEKFGTAFYGMSLNPLFLLDDEIEKVDETEEINEWRMNESLEDFGQEMVIPDIDISFLCERPRDCPSYKENSIACKCIRENFSSPQAFAIWRQRQIKELGQKIRDLIPTH